ncbi:MAG: hypothetical protein J6B87_01560 [Clostridia bacterium]|nr:hypothetical protein [Clostridia bacterium]
MKRKTLLHIIDSIILVVNMFFFAYYDFSFSLARFGNFLVTILVVGASAVAHYLAYTKIPDKNADTLAQLNSILQSEDSQFDTYMSQLKGIKKSNPEYARVIDYFVFQIDSFFKKEEALMRLISLNNGKAQEFLVSRNNDVQNFLMKNLKKLVKRLIAHSAKTAKNRSGSIDEDSGITEILDNNTELIDRYDQLLDEVARMGDDFNIEDPGLQSVIESLQALRVGAEDETDDDEIELFVTPSQSSTAK